jgi:exodeoxyribonuclease V alpha subunit
MQVRNNYDKDVFNGDIGRIKHIDAAKDEVRIQFDGQSLCYTEAEMDELAPAYAITVHKSQGSEYPAVILPLLGSHYMMLQRNLLYTAVTRAKKLMVLIGSKHALSLAVRNNRMQQRCTLLKERIIQGFDAQIGIRD